MKESEAVTLAENLLREFGCDGWRVEIDPRATRRFGQCRYSTKAIGLSRKLVALNELATVENTIRHEIAHALAGPNAGHGPPRHYLPGRCRAEPTGRYGPILTYGVCCRSAGLRRRAYCSCCRPPGRPRISGSGWSETGLADGSRWKFGGLADGLADGFSPDLDRASRTSDELLEVARAADLELRQVRKIPAGMSRMGVDRCGRHMYIDSMTSRGGESMQTATSQYGRKGIRVDDLVPTRAIRHWAGGIHVTAPDSWVEKEVRKEIADQTDPRWTKAIADQTVRYALWVHHENGAEYSAVMGASL